VPKKVLAILERHASRAQAMAKRVLEVMNPDGPESGRACSAELGPHRAAARRRAAFQPELFIRGCGCPS
jgi:hypothetical protein